MARRPLLQSAQVAGEQPSFRADVEGLRAVAVVAVLLFHVRAPGFTGGFVGVDVFYVISGFLITGLLVRELAATGRVDLVAFYARRLRRLLPAALIVIVFTTLGASAVLSALRFPDVAGDAAASALYVANYRFALDAIDYLASEEAASPFLHFWSLGVEEQFYLLWPLVILLGARWLSLDRLGLLLGSIVVASLWLSVIWTDVAAPWAFFSLPTRAWELALGGLIAVGAIRLPDVGQRVMASAAVWGGLGLIALSVLSIDSSTPYPGTAAILPVMGTAMVILGGSSGMGRPARWLSGRLPRWLGRISYSLYLWHWPLIVLVPVAVGEDTLALRLLLVGCAVVLAAASTELVEMPIRHGRFLRLSTRGSLSLAGICSSLVALLALGAGLVAVVPAATPAAVAHGPLAYGEIASPPAGSSPGLLPAPVLSGPLPKDLSPSLRQARSDLPSSYGDGCHLDLATVDPPACEYGSIHSSTTVMLLGDSHAAQWLPTLERLAIDHEWRLIGLTKSACPMVEVPVWNALLKRHYRECDRWRGRVLERVDQEDPDLVLVATADMYQAMDPGTRHRVGGQKELWQEGLVRMLDLLQQHAPRVVLLADTPRLEYDPVECLARNAGIEHCPTRTTEMSHPAYAALEEEAVKIAGVELVSATRWICSVDTCPLVRGSLLVFRDRHHLTATFASVLAGPLETALNEEGPLP